MEMLMLRRTEMPLFGLYFLRSMLYSFTKVATHQFVCHLENLGTTTPLLKDIYYRSWVMSQLEGSTVFERYKKNKSDFPRPVKLGVAFVEKPSTLWVKRPWNCLFRVENIVHVFSLAKMGLRPLTPRNSGLISSLLDFFSFPWCNF